MLKPYVYNCGMDEANIVKAVLPCTYNFLKFSYIHFLRPFHQILQ